MLPIHLVRAMLRSLIHSLNLRSNDPLQHYCLHTFDCTTAHKQRITCHLTHTCAHAIIQPEPWLRVSSSSSPCPVGNLNAMHQLVPWVDCEDIAVRVYLDGILKYTSYHAMSWPRQHPTGAVITKVSAAL